ncbi:hypothetical protein HanIR_Chr04g0163541 [Helianthus annuus]|nr:hypothetical protein HanIR_Chr04g0163541 [Helianthus annuus]
MHFVDAARCGSTRLGSAQDRRRDIPPSCAPRSTREAQRAANRHQPPHHHDITMMMSCDEFIFQCIMNLTKIMKIA